MKMIFISNNWADAHQQTRLNALSKLNLSILSLAVFRNYYDVRSPHTPIFIGHMKHGSYADRFSVYTRLLYQLSKNIVGKNFLYVFGFDLMLICFIFRLISGKKIKIIYEVPDIREMFFAMTISGKAIRWIEKKVIPKIDLLIITSPDFLTNYFIGLRKIPVTDSLILENKIHPAEIRDSTFECNPEMPSSRRKIKIGYFGVLRCAISLNCLIKLAQNGDFDIILRGIFMPLTQHYEEVFLIEKNIQYLGPYQSPNDLNFIYSTVDVVWAIYPYSDKITGNHLFARTNRFYESLYFKKPFIVQKGTADAKIAKLLENISFEIDLKNEDETIGFLSASLTPDHLAVLYKNLLAVPENHYQITNEYNNLETWLQQNR